MGRFSIGEALGAGFGLIARAPLSVLAWGIVYYGLNMLPLVLLMAFGGEAMYEAYRELFSNAADPAQSQAGMEALNAASMQSQWVNGVSILTSLLAVALVHTAVYRAVIDPQDKGFFYMKLGAAEGWQALVFVCLYIMLMIALFVLMIPLIIVFVALGVASMGAGGDPSAADFGGMFLIGGAITLVALIAFLWLALRFSLAGPATYAKRSFQLFESWTLTKGHSWSLLGLALLLGIILFLLSLLMWFLLIVVVGLAAGVSGFDWAALATFFDRSYAEVMADLTPWLAGLFLLGAIATGISTAVMLAPFGSAYRQIAGPQNLAQEF